MVAQETVLAFAVGGDRFGYLQKSSAGVGERGFFAVDEAELAVEADFSNGDADQFAAGQFALHADLRDECDAVAHREEAGDGLQGGKFDVHVEGRFVAAESFDDFLAVGGRDDVGYEHLGAQLADADLLFSGQRMSGYHEGSSSW